MTDADCRQTSTRTLSVSVQYALDEGADMLSVLPRLEMLSFWERVVQPVCGGVMMIWYHPDKVNDPAEIARAHSALRKKYGWQMILTDFLSRLTGRIHKRAFIAITSKE